MGLQLTTVFRSHSFKQVFCRKKSMYNLTDSLVNCSSRQVLLAFDDVFVVVTENEYKTGVKEMRKKSPSPSLLSPSLLLRAPL